MVFIRSSIDHIDGKWQATIVTAPWLLSYIWEITQTEDFDTMKEAEQWILNERCYNQHEVTEAARSKMSYVDAVVTVSGKPKRKRNRRRKKAN